MMGGAARKSGPFSTLRPRLAIALRPLLAWACVHISERSSVFSEVTAALGLAEASLGPVSVGQGPRACGIGSGAPPRTGPLVKISHGGVVLQAGCLTLCGGRDPQQALGEEALAYKGGQTRPSTSPSH